jgi:hypothetical protein
MPQQNIAGFWDKAGRWITAGATGGASLIADKETREDVGHAFKRIGQELEEAFDGPWESFVKVIEKNIKAFQPPFSVQKVLMAVKAIALGGGSVLADGGVAALSDFIFSKIMPHTRAIGEAYGGCIGEGREQIADTVEKAVRKETNNKVVIRLAREISVTIYDILTGYPQCTCEEGCISPLSRGLKDAGGIPGIIGTILWYAWPFLQMRQNKDVKIPPEFITTAPCLYWYANNGQFLLNMQLGKSATGGIKALMQFMSEDTSKNMAEGMPKSFAAYRMYLVDLVARGYAGPEAMGGTTRKASYYFEHPDEARKVLDDSNIIERQVAKVTDAIDKYVGWLDEAYAVGKIAYDLYESRGDGKFDFGSIDAGAVMNLAKNFLGEKARNLVEAPLDKYTREITEKLDMGGVIEGYAKAAKAVKTANKAVKAAKQAKAKSKKFIATVAAKPPVINPRALATVANLSNVLKAGGIAGLNELEASGSLGGFGATKGQAFIGEWQVAQIGLEARQRWNSMIYAWASMTDAERQKMRLDEGKNEQLWARTGVNYNGQHGAVCGKGAKSWYYHLTTDKRAIDAVYNIRFPSLYVDWLASAKAAIDKASPGTRKVLREGAAGVVANPGNWKFVIPETLVPSPRDVGYPVGAPRQAGIPCTPAQYILWVDDLLSLYDPRRWKKTYDDALYAWTHTLGNELHESWRKEQPSAVNPPVVYRKPLVSMLGTQMITVNGRSVPLAKTKVTGGFMTPKNLWAIVFDTAGIKSLYTRGGVDFLTTPLAQEAIKIANQVGKTVFEVAAETQAAAVVVTAENDMGAAGDKTPVPNWTWLLAAGVVAAGVGTIAYSKRR